MNIVILGPAHPLRPGGITTFNERLCKALLDAGHQSCIWSFSLQYPGFLFPGSGQFTDAPAPANIPIKTLINSINPLNWIKVGRLLRKEKPNLIIVRYWIPFMGACLGTILRFASKETKVICISDNVIPHEKRPGDTLLTRYFIKPVQGFVVMSDQVLKDLRLFSQKPATLLPHPLYDNFGTGIEVTAARNILNDQFNIQIEQHTPLLVFFGLVRPYKGLDLLLEAIHLVKNTSIKLLVAGEFYDDEAPYRSIIQKYKLEDRVLLHPYFISEDAVKNFICAADCIIQPYKNATQSGVTPVAYHFEIPMIVTNVGGLPQMVPHGKAGLVCEPTKESIATTIDAFFNLGKNHFKSGLQQEKQKLSWPAFTNALLEMYNRL